MDTVNIVGSGDLGREFLLERVAKELAGASYDPDAYPAIHFRLGDDIPLVVLFRTGKYIITGGSSVELTENTRVQFLDELSRAGIIPAPKDEGFEIKNIVFLGDLGLEVDLSVLAVKLGLDKIEYEPEQFPSLVYRPNEIDCVALIFSTGSIVLTGTIDRRNAETLIEIIRTAIHELGDQGRINA